MTELEGVMSAGASSAPKLPKRCEPTVILKAEPLDPSFTWRGHKPERSRWRSIALLLAIAVGAGFLVGRLSTAVPVPTAQQTALEQQAASAGVAQSQGASQSDGAAASNRSIATTNNTEIKPVAKDATKEGSTASSTETPRAQSTTGTDKGSSNPSVVLINPSTADKASGGDAAKQPLSKTGAEAVAKAYAKTEAHKAVDDDPPAATPGKRQTKERPPARAHATAAPARQEPAAVRRDGASMAPRRDDSFVASRRDGAYVPPRVPQSTLSDQRERYGNVERDDDRARLEQRYPERRFIEPDRRYAEDVPPPRDPYSDYRRGYLRPFEGSRDFREYRRFGGYDDDPYGDRRPVLRPMYGGRDD